MFMLPSSWRSHCESSPGSRDECRTAPDGCQPLDQAINQPSRQTWAIKNDDDDDDDDYDADYEDEYDDRCLFGCGLL